MAKCFCFCTTFLHKILCFWVQSVLRIQFVATCNINKFFTNISSFVTIFLLCWHWLLSCWCHMLLHPFSQIEGIICWNPHGSHVQQVTSTSDCDKQCVINPHAVMILTFKYLQTYLNKDTWKVLNYETV